MAAAAAGGAAGGDVTGDDESDSDVDYDGVHGHFFCKKTFHRPTYCHHCTDILWGLIGQGYTCEGDYSVLLIRIYWLFLLPELS